jgi:hypothetical protein
MCFPNRRKFTFSPENLKSSPAKVLPADKIFAVPPEGAALKVYSTLFPFVQASGFVQHVNPGGISSCA